LTKSILEQRDASDDDHASRIRGNGASLAPMYDVMCGDVWQNVTKNLAQKIAGASRGDLLKGRHWSRFARECGLNPRLVLDRVKVRNGGGQNSCGRRRRDARGNARNP
jgi:serine/threonine-protein kinase HipA